MNKYFGVISKIIDPDLYTIEVEIPGENTELKAFPKRGEVDEPRVGDPVWLEEIDPLYHSYYLYEKLKENNFIGIRSRGKVMKITADEIRIGIFDPEDNDWYDKNDGVDPTPETTSWLKIDKDGNIEIEAGGNQKIHIAGNSETTIDGDHKLTVGGNSNIEVSGDASVKVSGNTKIESSGNCDVKASGNMNCEASGNMTVKGSNVKVEGSMVQVTGGNFQANGTAAPSGSGPFCGIPACIFSGVPHVGNIAAGC